MSDVDAIDRLIQRDTKSHRCDHAISANSINIVVISCFIPYRSWPMFSR
jgi:hypothetical protein